MLPFSLKPQIEETDVDVGGAAQSHDLRLAAHIAVIIFFPIVFFIHHPSVHSFSITAPPPLGVIGVAGALPSCLGVKLSCDWLINDLCEQKM